MMDYIKLLGIAWLALAVLIIPSSAVAVGNCSGEDLDYDNFSSRCEARTCYEYGTSVGQDEFQDLDRNDNDGTGGEISLVPWCYPPVAYDSNMTTTGETPVEITLYATDPDSDAMVFSTGPGPLHGTLGEITGNKVVYTPDAYYTGTDSFSFRAHDGTWDSNTATVIVTVEPDCSHQLPHLFYGNVTINGEPAPYSTLVAAAGPGIWSNRTGNPVATDPDGSYGSSGDTAQHLVVRGCIEDGAPITFSVNGKPAEVSDVNTSGPWQSSIPFHAGGMTGLNIRVLSTPPPPDQVSINALDVTITNSRYGFSQTIKLEKNPWIELRVTGGVVDIQITATGYHDFRDKPKLSRVATLGIYEDGIPVSPEITIPFGSRKVSYSYVPTETRTFDILIYVNESPEIRDVKHITVYVVSGQARFNITSTAGTGGSISPSGQVLMTEGGAQRFFVSPSFGYHIADVIVDGQSKGATSWYTFSNINSDHQIHATFAVAPHYTITATAGTGGSISPAGQVSVVAGAAQRFGVTPSDGYQVADVMVDGQSKGAITSYTFSRVHADRQIHATFAGVP